MIKEFKNFVLRGNVLDLAVAVIIGAAFSKIVGSLVTDIITPLIGLVMGGVDFSGLSITVGDAVVTWGLFVQSIIDFLVIAFVVFLIVKAAASLKRPAPAVTPETTTKECMHCFSVISVKASRCPNCTSELD